MAVKVAGVRDVMRKLKSIEPELQRKALRTGVTKAARVVLAEAKSLAPVDTGALRDSIKIAPGKRKRGRVSRLVQIGEGDFKGDTWYGAAVEYGTSRMAAKPFMTPAYESKADDAREIMIDETIKAVDAILRKMSVAARLSAATSKSKVFRSASKASKKIARRATKAASRGAKKAAKSARRSAKKAAKSSKRFAKKTSKAARKQAKATSKVVRRKAKKAKRAAARQAKSVGKSFQRRQRRRQRRR